MIRTLIRRLQCDHDYTLDEFWIDSNNDGHYICTCAECGHTTHAVGGHP